MCLFNWHVHLFLCKAKECVLHKWGVVSTTRISNQNINICFISEWKCWEKSPLCPVLPALETPWKNGSYSNSETKDLPFQMGHMEYALSKKKKKQTNKISAAPLPIWAGLLQTVEPVTNRKLLYQPTYFPEEKLKERFFFIWFVILIWNFTLLMVQLHDFFIIFLQWPRQLLQFVGGLHWKDWLHFMGSLIDQSSIQQIYGFFRSHHIFIKVNDLQNHVTVSWFMIIKTYTLCRSSLDFSSFLIIKFMILF